MCIRDRGDTQFLPGLQEHGVVTFDDFLGGDAFLVSPDGDGSAVGVAARDHQDIVALHTMVTGKYVGAKVAAGDMTEVKRAVGIGPSNSHKDTFRQWEITRYDLRI